MNVAQVKIEDGKVSVSFRTLLGNDIMEVEASMRSAVVILDLYVGEENTHVFEVTCKRTNRCVTVDTAVVFTETQLQVVDTALGLVEGRRVFYVENNEHCLSVQACF